MRMQFMVCCVVIWYLCLLSYSSIPTITSFTPTSGPVGTVVTITGTNLSGAMSVKFNNTTALTLSENTASSLKATVPPGATSGKIVVSTSSGLASSLTDLLVLQPPTIDAISAQSVTVDTVKTVNFSVHDLDSSLDALVVKGTSSNTTLIKDSNINSTQTGSLRVLTLTPETGVAGSTTITLTVTDSDGLTAHTSFVLAVNRYRPDLYVRPSTVATYTGIGVYSPNGVTQTVGQSVANTKKATYYVTMKNNGNVADTFIITGSAATAGWTVVYTIGSTIITGAVTSTGWTTTVIKPGVTMLMTVSITPVATLLGGAIETQTVTITSRGDSTKVDACVLETTLPVVHRPDLYLRPSTVPNYSGVGVYSLDGSKQTISRTVANCVKATYYVTVRNNGNVPDIFTITGPVAPEGWTVVYSLGSTVITGMGTSPGWTTPTLNPGATVLITVAVTPGSTLIAGAIANQIMTVTSVADPTLQDVGVIGTSVQVLFRPDLSLRLSTMTTYTGSGVYTLDGTNQTVGKSVTNSTPACYDVLVKNNGNVAETYKIIAPAAPIGWTAIYTVASTVITSTLTSTGWTTPVMNPGATVQLNVSLTPGATVLGNSIATQKMTVISSGDTTKQDAGVMTTTVARLYKPDLSLRPATTTGYTGMGVYNLDGAKQTVGQAVLNLSKATYYMHAQNNGNVPDSFSVTGTSASEGWTVEYKDYSTGTDISTSVTGVGWTTPVLNPGAVSTIAVYVTPGATVSADAATSQQVTLTSKTNSSSRDVGLLQTLILGPPTLIAFSPSRGGTGQVVTLTGTIFWGATSVKFNGIAATTMSVLSATSISVVVPVGASTGKINVTTPGGTVSSATNFSFIPAPTLTSVSPSSGIIGTLVTLTGTNFTGATSVKFNGTAATIMTVLSATSITAKVPDDARSGKITVTTPGGTTSSVTDFTVYLTPSITSFTPSSGPVGTEVTLTGTNFNDATSVVFIDAIAASFTVVNENSITASVPIGANTGTISVTAPGGVASSATSFDVIHAPTLTSFTPGSGNIGFVVKLTGTNFTGATAVTFNGIAATTMTVDNATSITVTVPNGTTSGKIIVTTPGGTATSATDFLIVAPPILTNFTPTSGSYGTEVTLSGTNFTGVSAVAVNGAVATNITVLSATALTFTIPSDATTGKITVTGPGGIATSTADFPVTLVAGATRINPIDHSVMIWIPGATFIMGTIFTTPEYPPTQQVTLSGYWISKYEVTVAQYREFCNATGYSMAAVPEDDPSSWVNGWTGLDNHPIVNINWFDASAYAQWAGLSLPTEAQWEYASRGPEENNYPWGGTATGTDPYNGWDPLHCSTYAYSLATKKSTWPVGSFPKDTSWCGAMDMAGNVSEYCQDYYSKYSFTPVTDPTGPVRGSSRIIRGGSWGSSSYEARGTSRLTFDFDTRIGIRCATSTMGP